MNKQRAKDIASSPVMVDVTYNGTPVYIEAINQNTAKIHLINHPNNKQEVSLNDLIEQ